MPQETRGIFGKVGKDHRQNIGFTFKEVLVALMRQKNVHDGLWALTFEFDLRVSNVIMGSEVCPAAFVPIVQVSMARKTQAQLKDVPDSLWADASIENPSNRIELADGPLAPAEREH